MHIALIMEPLQEIDDVAAAEALALRRNKLLIPVTAAHVMAPGVMAVDAALSQVGRKKRILVSKVY